MSKLKTFQQFKRLLTVLFLAPTLLYGQTKSVLWLGNSYTAVNNLPDMVKQLALSGGDSITYDSNTPGGYTLQLHSQDAVSLQKINAQQWDYVVMQCQSQEPSLDTPYVVANVFPYARMLDSLIHVNDSCTQSVFYMTWGRKNGDASNCAAYPPVCTYQGMQDQLRNRYLQMGYDNGAIVAPCGEAWRDAIATSPAFDLYMADESHPSLYGSYLNACVFYATIYRRSPVGLTYTAGLTSAEALFLQQVASACVLDSMQLWNTEVYYDTAGFYAQDLGGNAYFFSSPVQNSIHYWNMGSGYVTDTSFYTFTFPGPGTYLVSHVTDNGCLTDTSSQWITVGPTNVWNCIPKNRIVAFPVPADESITVKNPFDRDKQGILELIDLDGKIVLSTGCSGDEFCVPTAEIAEGFYTMRISQGYESVSRKVTIIHE